MRKLLGMATALATVALVSTTVGAQGTARARGPAQQGEPRAQASQGSSIEFGIDGAINFFRGDNADATTIEIPNGIFRIGFHRNPTWSIEPYTQITYLSTDASSISRLLLGAGLLYHLSPSRVENQWYVRPFLALDHTGYNDKSPADNDDSTNQLQLGAGFGLKMPLKDQLGARFEINLGRALESGNDVPGYTIIGLQAGFSYYTR